MAILWDDDLNSHLWSRLTYRTEAKFGRTTFKQSPHEEDIPQRRGDHKPTEKAARELAGGTSSALVPWEGIGWTEPVKTPIVYPKGKNRPTKVPLGDGWSDVVDPRPYVYDYGDAVLNNFDVTLKSTQPWRSVARGAATWHHDDNREQPWTSIPLPEGHHLPEGVRLKGHSVINTMTFSSPEETHLDTAPIEEQAKAGYTNHHNAVGARSDDEHQKRAALQRFGLGLLASPNIRKGSPPVSGVSTGVVWLEGDAPGDYWRAEDRKQRKVLRDQLKQSTPEPWRSVRLAAIDGGPADRLLSQATGGPEPIGDSLASLRGRHCKSCLTRYELEPHQGTKTAYCSERCRNRAENARRSDRDLVGTVQVGDGLHAVARGVTLARWQAGVDRRLAEVA